MKKRLFTIILAFILVSLFCGCGCENLIQLSFNNAFMGENTLSPNYVERITYDVNYATDGDFKLDASFPDDVSVKMENGKFTTVLSVLAIIPKDITTDIEIPQNSVVYKFETDFSITSTYTLSGGKTFTHDDTLSSIVYFLPNQSSFAPLYSKSESSYQLLYTGSGNTSCNILTAKSQIMYNSENYTVSIFSDEQEAENYVEPAFNGYSKATDYEYSPRTLIDNSELLFAIRNISIPENSSFSLPVVVGAYGNYKTLSVSQKNEFTEKVNVQLNGNPVENDLSLNKLFFDVNETGARGMGQYVYVQKSASADIPNKAYIYKYETPLPAYGLNICMGSLIYTLKSLEF